MEEIQKEEKKAKKKDYYKILEISRSSDDKDIRSAFRRLAGKWHPDKNTISEEQREYADRMFKDINEAYVILSDTRKRQIYDLGGNPEDIIHTDTANGTHRTEAYAAYKPNYTYRYDSSTNNTTGANNFSSGDGTSKKSKKKTKKDTKHKDNY
jgi:DnaJ-class molecular chaperone